MLNNELDTTNKWYSHGTTGFMAGLEDNYKHIQSNIVAINMQTLLRNMLSDKDMTVPDAIQALGRELHRLAIDLINILEQAYHNEPPSILFYLHNYRKMMPDVEFRPLTAHRGRVQAVVDELVDNSSKYFGNMNLANPGRFALRFSVVSEKVDPIVKLKYVIQDLAINRKLLLFSHEAIDMHVHSIMSDFILAESHTGKMYPIGYLPHKVFGKYDTIPFYPETHTLLGDRTLFPATIPVKGKKELAIVAGSEHWKTHPRTFVVDRLRALGLLNKSN